MPRLPQVTRTMQTTLVKAVCMNLETKRAEEIEIRIPRDYKSEQQLSKPVKAALDGTKYKLVYITEWEPQTVRFRMTEQDYINKAEIIEII